MDSKIIISGILILLLLVSGMWLSLLGRPLNTIVFSLHKIVAIAAVVLVILAVLNLTKGIDLRVPETWGIILSGLFLLLALVSGGLLSFESLVNNFTRMIHKLTPYLFVASIILTVVLLIRSE